jgi:hypothetical protein
MHTNTKGQAFNLPPSLIGEEMQSTATLQQDELTTLIAKIKGNSQSELDEAECISQVSYNRSIDELDLMRAKEIWHTVRIE